MSTLLTKIAADFTTQLTTGLSVGVTTATLLSQTDDDGNTLPDGNYTFTLDGASSNKEHIRCVKTGAALTSIQSLSRQGALTTGVVRAHRVGCSVTITDWAQLKYLTDLLSGTTDLDSTDPLKYDGTATISNDAHLATKKYVDDTAIAGAPKATDSVYGITKLSVAAVSGTDPIAVGDNDPRVPTQAQNDALAGTSGTAPSSSNKFVDDADTAVTATASKVVRANASKKIDPAYIQSFAGDGSDGALSVASGTTNIDLGGEQFVVKQFTSISITGTGKVTFSNPHASGTIILIKSQGNCTLTSSQTPMLDFSGLGGAGGTGGVGTQIGAGTNGGNAGTAGTNGTNIADTLANHGGNSTSSNIVAAVAGTQYINSNLYSLNTISFLRGINIACGSGGGGGQGANNQSAGVVTGGAGGRGGGAAIVQVGGAWNFTTTSGISVNGLAGSNGAASTSIETSAGAGGGGGGSAGMFICLYNTLTSNSGTITALGGAGGAGGNATGTGGGSGGNAAPGAGGAGAGTLASVGAAGVVNGIGANSNGPAGTTGSAGAGSSGGGGAFAAYNSTSTYTGGAGGSATANAASTQTLVTKNNYFA